MDPHSQLFAATGNHCLVQVNIMRHSNCTYLGDCNPKNAILNLSKGNKTSVRLIHPYGLSIDGGSYIFISFYSHRKLWRWNIQEESIDMIINLREYKSLGFLTYHKPSRALYITTTSGIVRMNVSAKAPSGRYVNATALDLKRIGTQTVAGGNCRRYDILLLLPDYIVLSDCFKKR